jgi:putative salt-induced outer membrane protein YdiY
VRRLRCSLIAGFSLLAAVQASAQSAAPAQPDPADVRLLESSLAEALHARHRQRLESLLAADYVLRGAPDIDRETWLQNAVTLCWGDRSDIDRFRARRHDDVVIASFELTFYVDPATCQAGVLRSLVTDVWVREPAGWKLKVRHAGAAPASPTDVAAQYGLVPEPPPVWEASSELSAVATGGNTSTRTIGMSAQVAHRIDRRETEADLRFLTSQADDVTNARLLMVKARHGFSVTERVQVFGAASYARDRFAGIEDRVTATAGVAYMVPLTKPQSLTLEAGLGWTAEDRSDLANLRFTTATGALDYRWAVASGTELREEATFNADLESVANWRSSSTTALTVSVTRVVSLRASYAVEYRNRPVVGFGRTDMRTAVALVLSITRRPAAR